MFRDAASFHAALNEVIYASRAIRSIEHLKGRGEEIELLLRTLATPGRQSFIYGLRGAGKTSLAVSVSRQYARDGVVPIICEPGMTFSKIVKELIQSALNDNALETEKTTTKQFGGHLHLGFFKTGAQSTESASLNQLPDEIGANEAFRLLNAVAQRFDSHVCFIIDEFDQLNVPDTHLRVGLLAKHIADSGSNMNMILCGVADDIQQIFKAHPSTLRIFEPIPVNRLNLQGCLDIIADVEERLGLEIERDSQLRIAKIGDGFPYFVHLIVEKLLWNWFTDAGKSYEKTSPSHYEKALADASRSAAPELSDPYNLAVQKYAQDGELIIWALANGHLMTKQIKEIYRDYRLIVDHLPDEAKPGRLLNQNQFSSRLRHFMTDAYGNMISNPRRSYYEFTEKRMRGYARLKAALCGVDLRPDHPFS